MCFLQHASVYCPEVKMPQCCVCVATDCPKSKVQIHFNSVLSLDSIVLGEEKTTLTTYFYLLNICLFYSDIKLILRKMYTVF